MEGKRSAANFGVDSHSAQPADAAANSAAAASISKASENRARAAAAAAAVSSAARGGRRARAREPRGSTSTAAAVRLHYKRTAFRFLLRSFCGLVDPETPRVDFATGQPRPAPPVAPAWFDGSGDLCHPWPVDIKFRDQNVFDEIDRTRMEVEPDVAWRSSGQSRLNWEAEGRVVREMMLGLLLAVADADLSEEALPYAKAAFNHIFILVLSWLESNSVGGAEEGARIVVAAEAVEVAEAKEMDEEERKDMDVVDEDTGTQRGVKRTSKKRARRVGKDDAARGREGGVGGGGQTPPPARGTGGEIKCCQLLESESKDKSANDRRATTTTRYGLLCIVCHQ